MNDTINTELVGDADALAALMAEANTNAGEGEAAQPEGAFVADDADEATRTIQ